MALQAISSFSMCIGFGIGMVSMAFSGAAIVMVRIQTSGAILIGTLVAEALHICNEHFEVISRVLFAYKAAIQDGGFVNG